MIERGQRLLLEVLLSHTTHSDAALFWANIGQRPLYSFGDLVRGKLENFHQITAIEVRSQPLPELSIQGHREPLPRANLLQLALVAQLSAGHSEQVLAVLDATSRTFIAEPIRWIYKTPAGQVREGEIQQSFAFCFSTNRENREGRQNFIRACRVFTLLERDTTNPLAPIASSHLREAILALVRQQPSGVRPKL